MESMMGEDMVSTSFRTGMVLSTRPVAGLSGVRETDAYNGMEFLEQ